jgi:predicted peroxiredoxin
LGYKLGEWFLDTFPEKAARFFKTYSDEDPGEYVQRLGNQLVNMFLVGGSMVGLGASVTYNNLKDKIKAKFGRSNSNLSEAKKKKLTADEANPSELRMGIKVEMEEHTDDPKKAEKIALDHLAENPFYYTQLKLSGVDVKALPSKEKKAIASKKDETELIDKANQMKTPKGVEKIKASANKAKKETNKLVKGVKELTHTAKRAKGVKGVMAPTGSKMKKIKEGQLNEGGEWTITGTLTKDEQDKLKDTIGNYTLKTQETDDTIETTISHSMYNDKTLEHAIKQVRGMLPQKKQVGYTVGFDDVLQSKLESAIHEILNEIFDGRDNMSVTDDISEINAKNIAPGQEFVLSADLGEFKKGEKVIVDSIEEDGADIRIVLINEEGIKDDFYLDPNDDIELV